MGYQVLLQIILGMIVSTIGTLGLADNWPQWRGPQMNGVSGEKDLPHSWSKTQGIVWRRPLPGQGGSTPVVWGDRVFLTSAESNHLVLLAASTTGEILWKQTMSDGDHQVRGDEGNYASPSPATDGKHVWAFMGSGELGCYSTSGTRVWQFNVQDKYGKFDIQFGMTSTPVLDAGRLYLQLLHSGGATVVALNATTGEEIWRHARASDARDECEHSYASPVIYRDAVRSYLLTHGADYIVAHRLADGAEIFRAGGLNPPGNYNPTLRLVASPVAVPGLIVVPSAKKGPVLALDPAAEGDITNTEQGHLWTLPRNTPDVPSPLVYDGLVYLCREDGTFWCVDAKTGAEVYQQRIHPDRYRASPVCGDGKLYLTSRDGTVTVIKTGRKFEMLAENAIDESISASPAISNERIYLRSFDALYAIGK